MMRLRIPLILLAAGLLALSAVGSAYANGGPHGTYLANTDACAACHETHDSISSSLLKADGGRALCDTCHNSGYSGSAYDPEGGQIQGYSGVSPAGPAKRTDEGGTATSAHMLGTSLQPPGGAASTDKLTCISCHDPHGTTNYRMFRTKIVWNGLSKPVNNFTATFSTSTGVTYLTGSVSACVACHQDYANPVGGSYTGGFRHQVNIPVPSSMPPNGNTPLEQDAPAGRVVCLTCHRAHGTTITNTASSGLAGFSSALKRLTDSGACSGCHFNNWP